MRSRARSSGRVRRWLPCARRSLAQRSRRFRYSSKARAAREKNWSLARCIASGSRRDRHFCALNCAALSDELFESEVFGHTRGAFTGAVAARAVFEEANRGTLFLDEVAELSPRAQAKLPAGAPGGRDSARR